MRLDQLEQYPGKHQHLDSRSMRDEDMDEEACYEDFWKEILGDNPSLAEVKKELYDYHGLLKDLPLLFDEITGGAISKPNTAVSAVLEVYHEKRDEDIEDAIREREEFQ